MSTSAPSPPGAHSEVSVDRISLHVSDMDPIDARRLAQAVALALAPTLALAPGEGAIDRLEVRVQARRGEKADELAERLANRLAAQLVRVRATEAGR